MLPDYSEWLTWERVHTEETAWAATRFYLTYAAHIMLLRSRYPIFKILEVGCGTGWVPTQFGADIQYLGIDKNKDALDIAIAKNIPSRAFLQADLRILEGTSVCISPDLVCAFAVLKHFGLDEWDKIFDTIVSLAPFGLFTMNVAKQNRDDGIDFHHVWVTPERLSAAIERNGAKLLYSTIVWQGETWERKTGEEWIFATRRANP
jgi:SAM-dependent methyltransferase